MIDLWGWDGRRRGGGRFVWLWLLEFSGNLEGMDVWCVIIQDNFHHSEIAGLDGFVGEMVALCDPR